MLILRAVILLGVAGFFGLLWSTWQFFRWVLM